MIKYVHIYTLLLLLTTTLMMITQDTFNFENTCMRYLLREALRKKLQNLRQPANFSGHLATLPYYDK